MASPRSLIAVFLTLVLLTAATVAAAGLEASGTWEIAVAIGVASVKASLVGLYFMHLRHEDGFLSIVFLAALACLALFLLLTLADVGAYQGDLAPRSPSAVPDG